MKLFMIFAFLAGSLLAQVAPRTDTNTTQLPNPMPTWGGANGAGTVWANPAFNNFKIIRLTDANTLTGHGSPSTADTGSPRLTSMDSTHVIVHHEGASIVLGFDPAKQTVTKPLFTINNDAQFSPTVANIMYYQKNTQLRKLTLNANFTGAASDVLLFDYATDGCLEVGFTPKWSGVFTVVNDGVFRTAFSNTGAQGSGRYVVQWSAAGGCAVLDTVGGTFTVFGVTSVIKLKDRFYIHAGGAGPNPTWTSFDPTNKQPNGKNGCLTAKLCGTQYFWQVGTANVVVCGPVVNGAHVPPYCDGHLGQVPSGAMSGRNYTLHSWPNPAIPLTSMGLLSKLAPDTHQSEVNGADIGGADLFIGSQQVNSPAVYPTWGYNEIMSMPLKGPKPVKVKRYGQNLNTGKSTNFVCQNAIIDVFQRGDYALFTSDMGGNGVLGYEADGKTSRCDVFAIEIIKAAK
jgi:hypothetical protein